MKTMIKSILLILIWLPLIVHSQESIEIALGNPKSIVDLRTGEGIKIVNARWKYTKANITQTNFNAPGPKGVDKLDLYPTGKAVKTNDITPKAGSINFDDSKWEVIEPTSLEDRRGNGLLSFIWYRINITIPNKIQDFDPRGSYVVFEIVVDDYAEIWVNGKLSKTFGQSGGTAIKGFNSRNRVILTKNAKPGEKIQLAILGINGPIADIPDNYIWVRSATLDFYPEQPKYKEWQGLGEVVRIDPALDEIIDKDAKIEKLADGFQFTEGPVWHKDGYLLFSDPNTNVIYKYDPYNGNISVYISKSGYSGFDIGKYHQPGSNGLAIDKEGRLIVCQHGNRQIIRHERKGPITVLADNYKGKKLNSPNDIVIRSDGAIFFTDPPYGLPKNFNDPKKETLENGVYCIINGTVKRVATDLGGPNGIAFSPDEKYLYVSNWDIRDIHSTKFIWRYEVAKDGSLINGKEFFNMNQTDDSEALDGLKVDLKGNIYSSAPGGVWIISPEGKYLGKIIGPERPANMAWGDDGKSLYLTAHTGLYKIRTKIGGKIAIN
jgi:gluconolactonase